MLSSSPRYLQHTGRNMPAASSLALTAARAGRLAASRVPVRLASGTAHGHNFVFLGAPGVGKGTFASRIAKALKIPAISTGDIIRAEIARGSAQAKELQSYTNAGKLVPDSVVTKMVQTRLAEPDAARGFILDGYPRTVQQARDLDTITCIDRAVNITLPEHVLVKKLLARRACGTCGRGFNVADIREGDMCMPPLLPKKGDCDKCDGNPPLTMRADDTEAVVAERMRVYAAQTAPLIDFYTRAGKIMDFPVKKGLDDTPRLMQELGIPVPAAK